ncbi:uncharacterized protein N0V89_008147 [Didymosphaeria variabile]|uniref:Plastocyanin-like domain-containing protein n=1 Tax=Didymosphaeria variabile TaxID=1932322 RepID=A0A9W8XHJ5_9PLEO|nr:uncharacterized protein N0V89_008147 [Didymosphaeria variabile]KAJ4349531.1 hypothetical protein N0V89_008147 [Didymosphaeria variabile]
MTSDMLTGAIPSNHTRALIGDIALEGTCGLPANVSGNSSCPSSNHPFNTNGVSYSPCSPTPLNLNWTAQGVLDDATLVPLDNEPLYKNVSRRIKLRTNQVYYEGRGSGSWDGNDDSLYKTPAKRNNLVIPPFGWFLIRFRADNPGVWFLHCHIDLHLVGGMAATIVEAPDVMQLEQRLPIQNIETCDASHKCSVGTCNCKFDELSEKQSNEQCNTIFNSIGSTKYGALIQW